MMTTQTTADRGLMTGLEYMRAIAAGEIEGAAMVRTLGMRLASVDEGRVVLEGELRSEFENGLGIAHGGFAATMLDTALSCAINTVMPAGKIFTTLEMKINYLRPITRAAGVMTCIGTVVHAGKTTGLAEGRIVDANGKVYSHASVTCILFRDLTQEKS